MAIIEDDYDSEYRYDDRPLEPLHTLDRSGRVIYLGTFSKTLSPSLRLGFAVFPESLVAASIAMRELLDWQPPVINQQAMVRFIADGHLERHLQAEPQDLSPAPSARDASGSRSKSRPAVWRRSQTTMPGCT